MRLPAPIQKRLVEALVDAFPKRANFRDLARHGLGQDLDAIVPDGTTRDIARELVQWAEAHDKIDALADAAQQQNPDNHLLKEWRAGPSSSPAGAGDPPTRVPRELRDALQSKRLLVWVGDGARAQEHRLQRALCTLGKEELAVDATSWKRDEIAVRLLASMPAEFVARGIAHDAGAVPAEGIVRACAALQGATWIDAGWADDLVRAIGVVTGVPPTVRRADTLAPSRPLRPGEVVQLFQAEHGGWAFDDESRREAALAVLDVTRTLRPLALLMVGVLPDDDDLTTLRALRAKLGNLTTFLLAPPGDRAVNLATQLRATLLSVEGEGGAHHFLERLANEASRAVLQMRLLAYEAALGEAWEAQNERARAAFDAERYLDAEAAWRDLLLRIEALREADRDDPSLLSWETRTRVNLAACALNLRRTEEARDALRAFDDRSFVGSSARTFSVVAVLGAMLGLIEVADRALARIDDASSDEVAATVHEARVLLSLARGEAPPDEAPDNPELALSTGRAWLARGDMERATVHALAVLRRATFHRAMTLLAVEVLRDALDATVFERGRCTRGIQRERIEDAIVQVTAALDARRDFESLDPPLRGHALRLMPGIAVLLEDNESLDAAIRRARELDVALEEDATESLPLGRALELAAEGRIDEALALIPPGDPPWIERHLKVELLTRSGRLARARAESESLAEALPRRAPIERQCARVLWRAGAHREALRHARLAAEVFPARGYQMLLCELLHLTGHDEEAAAFLAHANHPGEGAQRLTIAVTARTAPRDQLGLLDAYLTLHPTDVNMLLERAMARYRTGDAPGATAAAIDVLGRLHSEMSVAQMGQSLFVAKARGGVWSLDEQEVLRASAASLRERFPTDPEAEALRFQIRTALGDRAETIPIDFALLGKSRQVFVGRGVEELVGYFEDLRARRHAIDGAYRAGVFSFDAWCDLTGRIPAAVVAALDPSAGEEGERLNGPTGFVGERPELVEGLEILVGELELLLLARIGLLGEFARLLRERKAHALLFEDIFERILKAPMLLPFTIAPEAERLVRAVANAVGVGHRDGWLATIARPSLPDGWAIPVQQDAPGLEGFRKLFAESLGARLALVGHPRRVLLSADLVTVGGISVRVGFLRHVRPLSQEFLRWFAEQLLTEPGGGVLPFDHAVEWLAAPADRLPLREQLSAFGLPTALTPEVLLAMWKRGAFASAREHNLLARIEAPARERDHCASARTALLVATLYATAATVLFRGGSADVVSPEAVLTTLLDRAEEVDRVNPLRMLDMVFLQLTAVMLADPAMSFRRVSSGSVVLTPTSPIGKLWAAAARWCGDTHARHIALGRGVRECLIQTVRGRREVSEAAAATLSHILGVVPEDGALLHPAASSIAVLAEFIGFSALSLRVLKQRKRNGEEVEISLEEVVADAAVSSRSLGDRLHMEHGAARSGFVFPALSMPVDAVLLRMRPAALTSAAASIAPSRMRHDARDAALLRALAGAPTDERTRRCFAMQATTAPWRTVREDPAVILSWRAPERSMLSGLHTLGDLLAMLSEGDLPHAEGPLQPLLSRRGKADGTWYGDGWSVAEQALQLPGVFAGQALFPRYLQISEAERDAMLVEQLARLEHPNDIPVGQLCAELFLLTYVARTARTLTLRDGRTVSLREHLLRVLDDLLAVTMVDPEPRTLAHAEDAVLRVCGRVVEELSSSSPISMRDGLWLTWRLYQWWCDQFDACHPEVQREALERLVAHAPALRTDLPDDRRNALDPFTLGRPRFDRRLAAVLFTLAAFGAAHEALGTLGLPLDGDPFSLSSASIEARLLALACREPSDLDRALRAPIPLQRELGWPVSAAVPDLALSVLLRLEPRHLLRAPSSVRLRWIESLPRRAGEEARFDEETAGRVVLALLSCCGDVAPEERAAFGAWLRTIDDSLSRAVAWRWFGFTALFEAGEPAFEADAARAVEVGLAGDSPTRQELFAAYLLALAKHAPTRWQQEALRLLSLASDPAGLTGAIGRVAVDGPRAQSEEARTLLLELTRTDLYRHDARHGATLVALGLQVPDAE